MVTLLALWISEVQWLGPTPWKWADLVSSSAASELWHLRQISLNKVQKNYLMELIWELRNMHSVWHKIEPGIPWTCSMTTDSTWTFSHEQVFVCLLWAEASSGQLSVKSWTCSLCGPLLALALPTAPELLYKASDLEEGREGSYTWPCSFPEVVTKIACYMISRFWPTPEESGILGWQET